MGIKPQSWSETPSPRPCPDSSAWPCCFGELKKGIQYLGDGLNLKKTGDDTDTLRKVEARLQAEFQDGVPPHLLPSAGSMAYITGSDQSRIFTSSHSEFSRLEAADVQGILRERLILVHGHPLDHNYGWDLPSLGRVYDVEKKITVLGRCLFSFLTSCAVNFSSFLSGKSPQA